jgi:hypothetical protein
MQDKGSIARLNNMELDMAAVKAAIQLVKLTETFEKENCPDNIPNGLYVTTNILPRPLPLV